MKHLFLTFAILAGIQAYGQSTMTINNSTPDNLVFSLRESDEDGNDGIDNNYLIPAFSSGIVITLRSTIAPSTGKDMQFLKTWFYLASTPPISTISGTLNVSSIYSNAPFSIFSTPGFPSSLLFSRHTFQWNANRTIVGPGGTILYDNVIDIF